MLLSGKLTEEEEIDDLLKAEVIIGGLIPDDVLDIVAAVVEFAVTGNDGIAHALGGVDLGDIGNADQNAASVDVAQTSLDIVGAVELRVDI